MFVRNHMTRNPVCMGPPACLRDVVRAMALHGIRHVPIVDERRHVLGMIGDHELRAAVDRQDSDFWDLRADEVMSRTPLMVESDAPFGRALAQLCTHGADALLVADKGVLVGILTRADFLRALSGALAFDQDGSSVEVAVDGTTDLVAAFEVLHAQKAEIKSVVAGAIRDDGGGAVLAVRLGTPDPRPVEKALAQAALTLLVPEEEMRAGDGVDAAS